MSTKAEKDDDSDRYSRPCRFELELREVKSQLEETVRNYQNSIEELQAANEELQAANEELRSTTEELGAREDELQSVNQELLQVNRQLENKVSEIGRTNNDLQHLMAAAEIATLFLDRHLRIKRYTPQTKEIFRILPHDIGRPLTDIAGPISYPELLADVERSFNTLIRSEREVPGSDGRYYIARISPYLSPDSRIEGVVLTFLDITGRKQSEEALQASQRQLLQAQKLESVGLLAGGIAHDFNNMLTAINGYSDLTLRRMKDDDPLRANLEEIKKAGRRSADLTYQLLAFSRRQVLQPAVIDLNKAIASTTTFLQRLIGENIQLNHLFNPNIGRARVDPGQFSQIIINLAVNARDAMPEGGKMTIETANIFLDPDYAGQHPDVLPGAYVMVTVSDTGTGMSEETKRQIFDPFFTTKEPGQGTGLGLATVYGIVNQSGGHIDVDSEEGLGTTFKIYLPRVIGKAEEAAKSDDFDEMPGGTETIMLVEDEELVRNLSRSILELCGYTVIEARHGAEALAICQKEDCYFDLLITDVVMPQMSGPELAEQLAGIIPNLKILFMSGYTDDPVISRGLGSTRTNFIQKPFTPESLTVRIREILDNHS